MDTSEHVPDHVSLEDDAIFQTSSQVECSPEEQRRNNREALLNRLKTQGDNLKKEGDDLFGEGHYVEAIAKYSEAAKVAGLRPVIMSNLATAYLKLEQYELAEWACDCALFFSPNMAKARFCRALARKGQGMNKGAELDLLVVTKHHPDIIEAQAELVLVRLQRKRSGDGQRADPKYNEKFPPVDGEQWDPPLDSDSEDSKHTGNQRPCKFYNHAGCDKGLSCDFSHAPDDKSIRDDLGRNVCLNFLLDRCKQKSRCSYSHDKTYLGEGWWSSTKEVSAATKLLEYLADPTTDSQTISNLENTSLYGRLNKARRYRSEFYSYRALTPDNLRPRTTNRIQNPAGASKLSRQGSHFVLLLCFQDEQLFDNVNEHLLAALGAKVKLTRARNATQASTYLEAPDLVGVIVTDGGIMERNNSSLMPKLVQYVMDGGFVTFGCLFPSFVSRSRFDHFFAQHFGLDWTYGSYFRTDFFKNFANDIVKQNPSLDHSYSMKALHVGGITPSSALYVANESSSTQSLVFPSTRITDFSESPAVSARVGNGRISFLGDVNAEENSTNTILAMLGLLDAPGSSASLKQRPETVPNSGPQASSKSGKKKSGKKQNGKKKNRKTNPDPSALSQTFVSFAPSTPPEFHDLNKASRVAAEPLPQNKFIAVFTDFCKLDDYQQTCLFAQLKEKHVEIVIEDCPSDPRITDLLSSRELLGVLVLNDVFYTPDRESLEEQIAAYARSGGTVIFGGDFFLMTPPDDFERFITNKLCLSWKESSATELLVKLNQGNALIKSASNITLPKQVYSEGTFLYDVSPGAVIYSSQPGLGPERASHVSVAYADIGKGHVAYFGNDEIGTLDTTLILAMLKL